jgi:two-component system sensor histidine kinase TctE
LFLVVAALLVLSGAGTWYLANRYGQRAAEQAYDMLLAGASAQILADVSVVNNAVLVDMPESAFELLALATEDRIIYAVFDIQGKLVTGTEALAPVAQNAGIAAEFLYFDFGGERFRLVRQSRHLTELGFTGEVTVVVGHTLIARSALADEIVSQALFVVLAAGLGLFAVAILAIRALLSPLRRIEQELQQRDPTDLRPVRIRVPVEIRANVRAINRFMGRLSNRIEAMQSLIADASHQLLTPITALSAYAQNAALQSDEASKSVAEQVRLQSEQIAHLARQLIDQAMIVHRADSAPMVPQDLREIAVQAERAAEIYFPAEADQLWLNLPEHPAMVRCDDFSMIEAVKNLVANACRHGMPPIRIRVEARDGSARQAIMVEDNGPGIPHEKWAELGRRFDRNRAAGPRSHGLGLAIAASVASAHGGKLVAERGVSGAFRCGIILPSLQPQATEEASRK